MTKKKVLLVDDDPDIRKIGRLSLTGVAKWEVVTASSGEDLFNFAHSENPDLILLDSSMPEDSFQLLSRMREDPFMARIPVIVTAVKVDQRAKSEVAELGARGLLTKPFNPRTLPEEIMDILAE